MFARVTRDLERPRSSASSHATTAMTTTQTLREPLLGTVPARRGWPPFAVGAIVTIAVTLGVRTSSDARPYLYNGGKLGCLEKESVFVGDKKKN